MGKNPGPIAFTQMPSEDQASAIALVSCPIAPFEAPYAIPPGNALVVCTDAKFTILPQPFFFISGTRSWDKKNGVERFNEIV